MGNIFHDLAKIFDAKFTLANLNKHYEEHTNPASGKTQLPKGMTKEEYGKKSEQVSLKKINGKTVTAASYGNRIAKSDGEWFVSYADGVNGNLTTAYPGGHNKVRNTVKQYNAKMIEKE